ncbi:IS110 family transposase [Clostridium sp. UBA4395]|uniref:IS110 family transposase n=1 Tax=Clostridium sp. UBA4395 TaxID=1946360 RepID=UPI003217CDD8
MNSVGIDVSKGKSTVAIMRPFGEIVSTPFEVNHSADELKQLAIKIKKLPGESRVIMEYTGKYFQPIANYLYKEGIFVSVVNAILIHDYSKSSIRKVKTDNKDSIKIANYGLDRWLDLIKYIPEEEIRQILKIYNRQYSQYSKLKVVLSNSLLTLIDQTFPNVNTLFGNTPRQDGHQKWIDFSLKFWHCDCVTSQSQSKFINQYEKWCHKAGYHYQSDKAINIYKSAHGAICSLPKNNTTKFLIQESINDLNSILDSLGRLRKEMNRLASLLPEYPIVMNMYGVGITLGPQLIAEIGDVRRFYSRKALIAFAGIDSCPYQSGTIDIKGRSISKRGSASLRKTLFQVMDCIIRQKPSNEQVYLFLDKKRSEGKHYYVYMIAGANKFLRIYYARVKEYLNSIEK